MNQLREHAKRAALISGFCLLPVATVWGHGSSGSPGGFQPAEPVSEINDPAAADGCPIESPDGLSLVIASRRGSGGDNDIWSADRASVDATWGEPAPLPWPINGSDDDFCPTPTAGRWLFFVSSRPAECMGGNIYLSRQGLTGAWSEPKLLPCAPQGPNFNDAVFSPSLVETPKGTYLFYSSFGERGDHDIYVSRLRRNGEFGPGRRIDALSNVADDDRMPNVRAMGHGAYEVVFSSSRANWGPKDEPAFGGQDVYRAVSHRLPFRWSKPVNLGPNVNTASSETRSTLSEDGKRLYFGRDGEIYVSER
ncbi:MAG: sialidase family protein [Pseudomonadales bacterium]